MSCFGCRQKAHVGLVKPFDQLAANRVQHDADPRKQLHALIAAPRFLCVGAIDCIVRPEVAPPSGKKRVWKHTGYIVACGAIVDFSACERIYRCEVECTGRKYRPGAQ